MEEACSLTLKWNDFESDMSRACRQSRNLELFTDVTFIVENRKLAAHRIVLSASSEFFKTILSEVPQYTRPTITLSDVAYDDLEAVVEYMYTGQLPFCPDNLDSILETAACFQIDSLMKVRAAVNGDDKISNESENISLHESITLSEISWNMNGEEGKNFDYVDNYEYSPTDNSPQESTDSFYDCNLIEGQSLSLSDYNSINSDSKAPDSLSRDGESEENEERAIKRGRPRKRRKKNLRTKCFEVAVEAVLNGLSISEAAWKYNVNRCKISRLLKKKVDSGNAPLTYVGRIKCKDPETKEFIKNALMNGDRLEKIASDLNLSKSAIYYHKKRLIEEGSLKPELVRKIQQATEKCIEA
ncbi:UNVERIFIED_CONTAM: hypothetical protein PYX00_001411 [Menopon gallinae]|uniref:BTB domain-containing protein n=1 Tax=Menopon gallinae TaxID=328185 RepID=A0AAW2ICM1_9NEOP